MTSTTLTGDRRWASAARKTGMRVIGKISVPKPINLPSQRLENHGLDPTVEIVPKGNHSWANRSSSSPSNAWGSSMLSPNTDGGSGSPSHLSGRPSSGGSGTRPSTAGSDRAFEPTANAWGPNSRPSSASGALTSNQTPVTSLRPRSAETRPGSSQLSRFAEPLSENSVAWGAPGTAEKLGVTSSKNDGFSLSSGDFPTLGSEKDNSTKNTESQDHSSHGRPGSSSGRVPPVKPGTGTSPVGDVLVNENAKHGAMNTWRRDNSPYVEDGVRPNVEKWQGDHQPYPNANMPPQHFDPWHGGPVGNPPGGVWYRGPPGGPPYGPPVPGGFPMEPYPYYHPQIQPQIPAPALTNSQPVPPPGVRPRGHHPKNGDLYRPHMPDAYFRPAMPIRPGFYPGPVAYENYYSPPMGYCNASERDIQFMGMAGGPSVYNRYASQNAPDSSSSHGRSSGYGSTGKALGSDQVESGHPHDSRGQYKVLLKHHNNSDGKEEEQKWELTATTNASPRMSSWEDDWRVDHKKDEQMDARRTIVGEEEASSTTFDNQGGSSVPVKVKLPESVGNVKAGDDSSVKKFENAVSAFPEVSTTPKDSTLIQKIEGLNAKARASDGRHDVASVSSREEQKNRLHPNAKGMHSTNEASTGAVYHEGTCTSGIHIPATDKVGVSTGDKSCELAATSGTAIPRRATHGMQGRVDHRGKGRFNAQEADGWRKKSLVADSSSVVSASNFENCNVPVQDCHTSVEATEKSVSCLEGKDEGESASSMFDPSDIQAQRAKMREIAKQRVRQLQKEEEERTREQKAKALAKLEELNRRTQAVEGLTLENVQSSGDIHNKQDESQTLAESTSSTTEVGVPNSALVSSTDVVAQNNESSTSRVGESTIFSREPPLEITKNACQESVVTHNQSLPSQQDLHIADAAKIAPLHNDSSGSKQKRMGYKQKHNIPLEKSLAAKSTISMPEAPKSHNNVEVNVPASAEVVADEIASSCMSSLPRNPDVTAEPLVQQKRKNYNKSGRNKPKLEETSSVVAALQSAVPKETNLAKSIESGKPKSSGVELDPSSVQPLTSSKDAIQSSEDHPSLLSEEAHGRVNNQWKSQNPRRLPRNQQVNRSVEKFQASDAVIWAPVRPQNKSEVIDKANHKTILEEAVSPTTKSDHPVQNNLKNKRAEMERYVPKPVAKELAQQGCIQQHTSSSISQTTLDETTGRAEFGSQSAESTYPAIPVIGKVGFSVEPKHGDSKQNKPAKAHGLWRQRSSTESIPVQLQDGFTSKPSKDEESIEHNQPLKPDLHSMKGPLKSSDEWNASDGWNMPDNPDLAAPVAIPIVKDQGVTGRGKWHPYKGQKAIGNTNHDRDHKNINSGDADKIYAPSSAAETGETDRTVALKENRGVGERSTSHWQPKSQAYPAHNQRGGRPTGVQNVNAEDGRFIKKDSAPQGGLHPPQTNDKEISEGMTQPHPGQSMFEKSSVGEEPNVGHQQAKRERKVASPKGRPHSLNQGSVSVVELVSPAGVDSRHEQQPLSAGYRKDGNQNSRFGRGHESRGDWSSAGQESKQHNLPANRGRQRHNSHYEYQQVGPYNNHKVNNSEGPADGSHNTTSRSRERGQNHSRRGGGNFYRRQSGTVRVDAGYDL